jgi:hypothetical protein
VETEPHGLQLVVLAESEPGCIPVRVLEPDLDPELYLDPEPDLDSRK